MKSRFEISVFNVKNRFSETTIMDAVEVTALGTTEVVEKVFFEGQGSLL